MYVCSKKGGTSTVLGRKKEREQRHSHPCQSHQVNHSLLQTMLPASTQPHNLEGREYISTPCSPTHTQYNSRVGLWSRELYSSRHGRLHCSVPSGQHANIKLHSRRIQITRRANGHTGFAVLLNSPAHRGEHGERRIELLKEAKLDPNSHPFKRHHVRVFHCASAHTQVVYLVACDYFCNYHTHLL